MINTEARQIAECRCPTCGQFNGLGFEPAAQKRIAALEARCARYEAALNSIASWNDTGANERLKNTGSYSAFDEPGSVSEARAALTDGGQG